MVAINKKRISNELLHIALVITLLRSGTDNRFQRLPPVISTNFFNDVSISNDIMGPSWAYSRTSFHHRNFYDDHHIHEIKALNSVNYWGGEDLNLEYGEDIDIDLNIINQLRSLTISRFNSLPGLGKNEPTFQDITAYLLSESNSPSNAAPPPSSVDNNDYDTPAQQDHEVDITDLSQTNLLMSPGTDSGNEETSDDGDAQTEFAKEFPPEVTGTVLRNSERRESYGFHSDSEEEVVASENLTHSSGTSENENALVLDAVVKTESSETHEQLVDVREEESPDLSQVVKPEVEGEIDLETLLDGSLNLSIPSDADLDVPTLELLEHAHINEIGGAAGIDHAGVSDAVAGPSTTAQDWDFDSVYFYFPELLLEAERSSLEFYKKFNDITEIELNNAIPPQDLHVFDAESEADGKPHSSSTLGISAKSHELSTSPEGSQADDDVEKKIKEDPEEDAAQPSSSNSVVKEDNQQNDSLATEDEDVFSAILDDFLEGDSGVFEFFGASPENADVAQDETSNNSQDSILGSPLQLTALSGNLDEASAAPEIEADESSFSIDMIQTAPLHASARPTSHAAQPRGFQVHSRMPGLLRGSSMEQRWQDLANFLSLQSSSHDPNGAGIHQPIPHHFAAHPYHHHHHPHAPTPLHHHPMHPPHFGSTMPPATPYSTDTARSVLLQNATLPPPELNTTGPYVNVGMGASSNLGSAVASSMHLTNSSEPMIDPSSHYKMMDPSHDMLYYQNSTAEMGNQTTPSGDGFNLSSILNDDELQLMDMAMNEGMYSMRGIDNGVTTTNLTSVGTHPAASVASHNCASSASCPGLGATGGNSTEDRMEASSDSAVSSMGSERVPPMTEPTMSDNEWADTESHPHGGGPHDLSPYSLEYSRAGKMGAYADYFKDGNRVTAGGPVAQKKHHMFGKRFQQEQGTSHPYSLGSPLPYPPSHQGNSTTQGGSSLELDKYGCSADFGRYNGQRSGSSGTLESTLHNHTYSLPPTHPDNPLFKVAKPQPKDKQQKMIKYFKTEDPLTRDEKKARAMNIPISTDDIINLPMDEFNERLSKYDLSEAQLSLIRDIRRRGKNKVAAQNCRKRKLDQIIQLADEVQRIREKKQALMREQEGLMGRRNDLKLRYQRLSQTVLQALRGADGNPYNPYEYELHHAADGSVVILPRNSTQPSTSTTTSSTENGMNHSGSSRGAHKPKDESKKE